VCDVVGGGGGGVVRVMRSKEKRIYLKKCTPSQCGLCGAKSTVRIPKNALPLVKVMNPPQHPLLQRNKAFLAGD